MNITSMDPYYVGDYERIASIFEDDVELEAYRRLVQSKFNEWADEAKTITEAVSYTHLDVYKRQR